MSPLPEDLVHRRRETGAHRFDEMWDGVLHMVPSPTRAHQDLEGALESWLRVHWVPRLGARVYHQINLALPGGWPRDFRIPDLVLLTEDRFAIDRDEYFEGAPTVVVEIESPDDDTRRKLPFYLRLGVPEVWIIHRDTKRPEILVLENGAHVSLPADATGWLHSEKAGVSLRQGSRGKLEVRVKGDAETEKVIP